MAVPRVAVVGAGAWGTTLGRLIVGADSVTLLCHRPQVAEAITASRRNERRLPGVDWGPAAAVRPVRSCSVAPRPAADETGPADCHASMRCAIGHS